MAYIKYGEELHSWKQHKKRELIIGNWQLKCFWLTRNKLYRRVEWIDLNSEKCQSGNSAKL